MEELSFGFASPLDGPAGQRVGSYRIIQPLGSGGMSTVFRAVHAETGHEVALKVLIRSLSRNSTLLQRFLREARSAETLEHPNIVAIYDRGIDHGRHYLVLEYVPGGDFHDYIQRHGPLGVVEAIGVIRAVAGGLHHASGRGLIHRDIKPSNILRTPTGAAKIIDLGLALQSEFEDERVTREGTTVGTVDYMSPEQARDSRATSIHSDMYSLGCTFYYLLAGIPPYPGGDIIDKLTRHARAPAPDVRDLRPDIPPSVAAILLRMMSKQAEDRFADYDELIAALDSALVPEANEGPAVGLVPLEEGEGEKWPEVAVEPHAPRPGVGFPIDRDDEAILPLDSLDGPSFDLADERASAGPRTPLAEAETPLPRLGRAVVADQSGDPARAEHEEEQAPRSPLSAQAWVLSTALTGAVVVLLVIGLHRILGGPHVSEIVEEQAIGLESDAIGRPANTRASRPADPVSLDLRTAAIPEKQHPPIPELAHRSAEDRWEEPEDREPVPGGPGSRPGGTEEFRRILPEWARAPSPTTPRPEDPFVVVRRVPELIDGLTEPTLHMALDQHIGGVVELADQGPLPIEDLRISGESRIIRPRAGYRPVVHIERSGTEPARQQSAILALDRKNLTLEGVDLIVRASDLSGQQRALFGCKGSSLTLRDCTITVLNPNGLPFTLIRQEPGARPSRILLERTLVRGGFGTAVELTGGQADVVLDGSAILGGGGPLLRVQHSDAAEQRLYLVDALLACAGPVVQCDKVPGVAQRPKPVVIRAYGSAFGRLQLPGIASIVDASDPAATAGQEVDWAGDRNLFAGWKGFFARGAEPTITVGSLPQARSTWNASERDSQEIILPWPMTGDPALATPVDLEHFLSDRRLVLTRPARPGPGLFEKTVGVYLDPMIPEPPSTLAATQQAARGPRALPTKAVMLNGRSDNVAKKGLTAAGAPASARPSRPGDPIDLVMSTSDPQWAGDLGAFLRARLEPGMRRVSIRVEGSGTHPCTPVRLPDGLTLEIIATSLDDADPLAWSSAPQSTGPGLLELHTGALVLANVKLRHNPESRLDTLIAVDDAHLVLVRCQLTVSPDSEGAGGVLVAFRAPTTRPMPVLADRPVLQGLDDRPVCRLIDSILIGNRSALRAEVGRGLIALTRCAVAAEDTAIELDPTKVARRSFAADLWLDRCTLVSGRTIVGLGPWKGPLPGPDRPWLVSSRHCAFLTLSDPRARDATLLRVDADAMAGGCLFWQAVEDAFELDQVALAGEVQAVLNRPYRRSNDLASQWALFRASGHLIRVAGPRGAAGSPAFRFRDRPRPGRIEPPDLILDPLYHPDSAQLDLGADLARLGIVPRAPRTGSRRN